MRVFVAGGSGTIGVPLVRALAAAGHQVTALTRTPGKQESLRKLGATAAVADALDRDALVRAVESAKPAAVLHQLTALPKEGVSRASDLVPTNRLRIEGTRNLLEAAVNAGARRFIGGSFALVSMSEVISAVAEGAGAPKPFAIPFWVVRLLMPYMAGLMSIRLPLSNAKARAELQWSPSFPTIRDGLSNLPTS